MAKRGGAAKERIVIVKYDATGEQIASLLTWMTEDDGMNPLLFPTDLAISDQEKDRLHEGQLSFHDKDPWRDFKVIIKIVSLKMENFVADLEERYPLTLEIATGSVLVREEEGKEVRRHPLPLTHWRKVEQILGIAPAE